MTLPWRIGSLFSGIGGLELGLERGIGNARTVWQVEAEPFCRHILERHWPDARRHGDVRSVGAHTLERVDVMCGGFPCQDISVAGLGAGIDGARSGLWGEYARLVRELRPRVVVVENVRALLSRGLGRVLGDLAELGYDAEWEVRSAAAVGAPHRRERLFILAANADEPRRTELVQRHVVTPGGQQAPHGDDADGCAAPRATPDVRDAGPDWRAPPSAIRRVDDGIFTGVDPTVGRYDRRRLRALGNAVVPQVAELVGRRVRELLERAGPVQWLVP